MRAAILTPLPRGQNCAGSAEALSTIAGPTKTGILVRVHGLLWDDPGYGGTIATPCLSYHRTTIRYDQEGRQIEQCAIQGIHKD